MLLVTTIVRDEAGSPGNALPAHEQSAELVVPGIGALDDPPPRLASHAAQQRRLTTAADVRLDPATPNLSFGVVVVVSLVEAEVLRAPRAARRSHNDVVQRVGEQPLVVDVGAADHHGDGHTVPIGQDMPLGATLGAVGGVGACEVPSFGAFTMALSREAQSRAAPCWCRTPGQGRATVRGVFSANLDMIAQGSGTRAIPGIGSSLLWR